MPPPRPAPSVRLRRLAAQLRDLREARGLTQEDVARQTGKDRSTLYRLENPPPRAPRRPPLPPPPLDPARAPGGGAPPRRAADAAARGQPARLDAAPPHRAARRLLRLHRIRGRSPDHLQL